MSKLHKKCFIASASMHGLLFLVLLVGPAFLMSRDQADDMPILTFIPDKLIDEPFSRQSTPTPERSPAPPQPPVKRVEPEKPKPVKSSEPAPTKPKAVAKVETSGWKPTPVDISTATRKRTQAPRRPEQPTELAQAAKKASQQINALAATPSIKISTPPGGGKAYANYDQMVKTIYEQNWHPPDETSRNDAVVTVQIVIARDGTIRSSRIIGRSGDSGVDASVEATLRRVTKVKPFPEGATENTRTYTIGFNLKAKRGLG